MNDTIYTLFIIFGIIINICVIIFIVQFKLGKTNIQGYTGLKGPNGNIGPTGGIGLQGNIGQQGNIGEKGVKGDPGKEISLNNCRNITQGDNYSIENSGHWRWRNWCPHDWGCSRSLANRKVCDQVGETLKGAYCRNYPYRNGCQTGQTPAKHILNSGEMMGIGTSIQSPGKNATMYMQGDGNLVVYGVGTAKGISNTAGNSGAVTYMQGDCNLVTYKGGRALWASNTANRGTNCVAKLGNDGVLSIYGNNGVEIWRK
jgi:hypothetical protein